MRAFARRLLGAARIWDYLLARPAGSVPPVRLGLEVCEPREQPGDALAGLVAGLSGGALLDPLLAMTRAVGEKAFAAGPVPPDARASDVPYVGAYLGRNGRQHEPLDFGWGAREVREGGAAERGPDGLMAGRTLDLDEALFPAVFVGMEFPDPVARVVTGGDQSGSDLAGSSDSGSVSGIAVGADLSGADLPAAQWAPPNAGGASSPWGAPVSSEAGVPDAPHPFAGRGTGVATSGATPAKGQALPASESAVGRSTSASGESTSSVGGTASPIEDLGASGSSALALVGSLGTDSRVNTYTTNSQAAPAVAADAVGNFVVAWTSTGQDGSADGIYAQRYAADGTALGSEFRVNTYTSFNQRNPAIAMDRAGNFIVTWESSDQEGAAGVYGVYGQRYSSAGVAQGAEFRVNTYTSGNQTRPAVAMDADGDFVVAWMDDNYHDGDGLGIYGQRYSSAGVAQGAEFRVNTYTTNGQMDPAVAMDAAGNFVVAWDSYGQDASGAFGVYGQRYSSAGVAQGSEFRVNTYTTGDQVSPTAAMDANGNFVIAWAGGGQDGSGYGVYAQRYTAAGATVGSEFRVNTYTTSAQDLPAAAMDVDGDFVVAWRSSGQDGSGLGVYAQRYAATGVPLGSEFRINSYTTNDQSDPASATVALDAVGNFIAAWAGEGASDALGVYMTVAAQLPRGYVPEPEAPGGSTGGVAAGAGANNPPMTGAGSVRYADGTIQLAQTDLWSNGYGVGWGQERAWTNAAGYAVKNVNGTGMVNTQQPFLILEPEGTTIAVVLDGLNAEYFDYSGGAWAQRFFGQDKLTYNAGSAEYVLTDTLGNVSRFHDFSSGIATAQRGGLKSYTDTAGNAVSVTYTSGVATEVTRVGTSGGSTVTESLLYTYLTSPDVNAGLVATVTLRRKIGAGSYSTVRSVAYTYYNGVESYGNLGDLKLATVRDAAGNAIETTYYRYYTAGEANGYLHGLKYLVGGAAYDRMTTALGTTLSSITNSQVASYADLYLEYDAAHRVTKERVAGAGGALSAITGQGEYTYTYTASANAAGTNSWAVKTVETLPDGTTNTVYTNAFGQVMLAAQTVSTQTWSTFFRYDTAGRATLMAAPSAVSGYSEASADLVAYSAGVATYLRDSDGILTTYAYASSTTATTSVSGDATGYLKQVALTHGETGAAVPQETLAYIKRTVGTVDFFVTATDTVYRNDNGTGAQTTTYTYTWQGTTAQPASVLVTLPAVTTAQNGSNASNTLTIVYDAYARPVWTKDAAGFISYAEYDTATGAVLKAITDVDTTQTGTFTNLPSGWATPAGGGLHLTTTYEVDALGRATKATSPEGRVDYTVYDDTAADGDPQEIRYYQGWNTTTNTPTGPTVVVRSHASGYTETLTMSAAPTVSGGRPTGAEGISGLQSLSRSYANAAGQVTYTDNYFNLSGLSYSTSTSLGAEGTNFYRTEYAYDAAGRLSRTLSPQDTVYRTVYDGLGQVVSEWVGTDDTPTSGAWSPTNTAGTNLVKVAEYEYDGGATGDGNLTKVTENPGGGAAARVTQAWYDWRNRAVATKTGVEVSESTSVNRSIVYTDYDNLDQATKARVYDGDGVTVSVSSGVPVAPSASLLRAQQTTDYDELGRAYKTSTYSVNTSTGAVSTNSLVTSLWYDARGLVIKESDPNGLVQKWAYDGAGRVTKTYIGDGGGDTGYADADDVIGDTVVQQSELTYDKDDNVLVALVRQRFHNASGTGELGTPAAGVGARVSYAGDYYDNAGRLTATVDVGTNGGTAWTRPGTVPTGSSTVLVTSYGYDAGGRAASVTDPAGRVRKTEYDALGRATKTVENYVDGVVSDVDDKTTTYTYNGAGLTSVTAQLTGGGGQTTEYVYGVTVAGGSAIESNDIVGKMRWPDPSTGAASASQQESATVNALGQTATSTDRNGSVHTLTYDVLGRVVSDAVTTLGTGVDGSVRRIETAYSTTGTVLSVTSYSAVSGGSIVNQVLRDYNGLGQLITEWQSHSGAVVTSTTPKIQYAYSFNASGTTNQSRLTSITYPSGYVLTYNYSSGLNNAISRLSSLSDSTGTVESYDYLGLDTVVRRAHPQPNVDLSYVKLAAEAVGDAGDQYTGLDRFGRVVDQRWLNPTTGTATDRFQYGYDSVGNTTYRDNLINSTFGELYTYDGLNQIASFARGTLNGTKTGITGTASRTQGWDYDAVGNFDSVATNGTSQTRTVNKQNEITSISGTTTPTYDANGNMTGDEAGKQFVYDAWNRLVVVKNSGGTTLKTYSYDGLNRRVTETASGTTTDLFYSDQWQVLEEKVGSNTTNRYVWSPVYADAMILRDRDTDANGTLDERLWVQQDANFNVTALINGSGIVVERYSYDPYGMRTVYDASYTVRSSGSSYDFKHGFQGLAFDAVAGLNEADRRWYSSTLGRWASLDPIRFAAGDTNLYRFVGNSPVVYTDPTGLSRFGRWLDRRAEDVVRVGDWIGDKVGAGPNAFTNQALKIDHVGYNLSVSVNVPIPAKLASVIDKGFGAGLDGFVNALPPEWAFIQKLKPVLKPAIDRGGITFEFGLQYIYFFDTDEYALFGFGGAGPSISTSKKPSAGINWGILLGTGVENGPDDYAGASWQGTAGGTAGGPVSLGGYVGGYQSATNKINGAEFGMTVGTPGASGNANVQGQWFERLDK